MSVTIIDHPARFKNGVRLIQMVTRNKDGAEKKKVKVRVSYSADEFDDNFQVLLDTLPENGRIYASASERDMGKAIRDFDRRRLDARYDEDEGLFFENLQNRWVSCLGAPEASDRLMKYWLFDCDNDAEERAVNDLLERRYQLNTHPNSPRCDPYRYETKSGLHIVTDPFNHGNAIIDHEAIRCLDKNGLMLWAY